MDNNSIEKIRLNTIPLESVTVQRIQSVVPKKNIPTCYLNIIINYTIIIILILIIYYSYHNDSKDPVSLFIRDTINKIIKYMNKIFNKNDDSKMYKTINNKYNNYTYKKLLKKLGNPISNYNYNYDNTSDSTLQKRGKSTYCYIGTDKGFRTCIQMGTEETCKSGDVYNSEIECKHPSMN